MLYIGPDTDTTVTFGTIFFKGPPMINIRKIQNPTRCRRIRISFGPKIFRKVCKRFDSAHFSTGTFQLKYSHTIFWWCSRNSHKTPYLTWALWENARLHLVEDDSFFWNHIIHTFHFVVDSSFPLMFPRETLNCFIYSTRLKLEFYQMALRIHYIR